MKNFVILSLLFSILACKTNKSSVGSGGNTCNITGTVKDFSSLDGCQLLIALENGDLLNPAKINNPDFELIPDQKIKFAYQLLPDMMSICMSEKAIVEITCIEAISADDAALCADTKNPFEIDWMDKALDRHNPQQVIKYKEEEEFVYLFKSIPYGFFYDCQGNFLCKTTGMPDDDCYQKSLKKTDGKGKIIWQGEGIWD